MEQNSQIFLTDEQKNRYLHQPDQISDFIRIMKGNKEISQPVDGIALRFWYNVETVGYPLHWHNSIELIMPIENHYHVFFKDYSIRLEVGDVLWIPSDIPHTLSAPDTGSRFIFQFDPSPISKLLNSPQTRYWFSSPILFSKESRTDFLQNSQSLLLKLADIYWNSSSREFRIYACILQFIADYRDYIHIKQRTDFPSFNASSPVHEQTIHSILDYIDQHYQENLTLEQVASSSGFSKFHFSRLFKQYTNQTFYNYLYQIRIQEAQKLLAIPSVSITEISMRTGFNSNSAFTRAFKNWTSYTPSEYRKLFNPN